jgi:hypothetical protein
MLITIVMPDQSTPVLSVADTDLIYDGQNYVAPWAARYVELYTLPTHALSLPFDTVQSQGLDVAARIRAFITSRLPDTTEPTDPSVVAVPDPSPGTCVCFVTCSGTELRFVKVEIDTTP